MQALRQKVKDFLVKYQMDYEGIDIRNAIGIFIEDMERGLDGDKDSLAMIPTYINADKEIALEEPVIVIDAGGTNLRVAVVHFDKDKNPVVEDYSNYPMPGSRGEITKEEFFTTIADYLKPMLSKSSKIGFAFSYSTEILENRDGRLIKFSKEVRVKGLEGELLGKNLVDAIKRVSPNEDKTVVMLNDTVATLLAGKVAHPDRVYDSYIGFVLGTGTNACYIEENRNIVKLPEYRAQEGNMIIVLESGGYKRARSGVIDKEYDSETNNPGEYPFEKMIGGRYLGEYLLSIIKKAANESIFSREFLERVQQIDHLETREVNDFLASPYSDNRLSQCCSSDDYTSLFYLIDSIVERAAKLTAIQLASIMMKTGKGKNPCEPVCISTSGSTFFKLHTFRNKLDYYIKSFLNDEQGLYCEFVKYENATLIGAAIAALLN